MVYAAGQRLPADDLNNNGAFTLTDYTPSWFTTGTQPSIGNGKLKGKWGTFGKLAIVRINWLAGSTTTYGTNAWNFGLPSALTGAYDADFSPFSIWMGAMFVQDVSAASRYPGSCGVSAGGDSLNGFATQAGALLGTGTPFAFASGDYLAMTCVFEVT